MKLHLGLSLKSIFLAVTVLAAGSALAANKGSLELLRPTTVAGKQLPVGNYRLQWEGSGDQVDLKIYQGKNVVVSTPARVLKVDHPIDNNSTVGQANADKTFTLTEIRFAGKKFALGIVQDAAGASMSGGSSK